MFEKENKIYKRFCHLLEYFGTIGSGGLWPEDALPASKEELKRILALVAINNPDHSEFILSSSLLLDHFVPYEDAIKAAEAWTEALKMQRGEKYDKEKADLLVSLTKKYLDSETFRELTEKSEKN